MSWSRLIRFVDQNGHTMFGEPCIETSSELTELIEKKELYALKFTGESPFELSGPGEKVLVDHLLPILTPRDVPIIKCIGLNYMKHSKVHQLL